MNSGLPPSRISVPRPAMLVADGHHPQPPRLRHDLRFALVELRVQHHVLHALALQNRRQPLRSSQSTSCPPAPAASSRAARAISSATALYFSFSVRYTTSGFSSRSIGLLVGNHHNLELVDLLELGRFGFRRARHAAQLLVQAEVILERDRGQRLVFLADVHAFLGLDRLVQPIAPAASRHQAAGEGVDDDHLAVLHHVLHIALVERVRLDRRLHVVLQFPVLRVGNVADAQQLLDRLPALVRHADRPLLLVHNVVAGEILLALAQLGCPAPAGACDRAFDLFAQFELRE